ncbi:MAG: electron transfer flavoprotein-ubiquinone oxidoreductase [Planctomycetota bacterium]
MKPRLVSHNLADVEREELPVDVCIVGAGPAGLACAIHLQRLLKQQALSNQPGYVERTVLVLDKAEEVGHHTLSGAVMDPRGIEQLFPDWRTKGFPIQSEIQEDWAELLRPNGKSQALKGLLCPPPLRNHGNVMVSLNEVVQWLAKEAEALGTEIYAGFPVAETRFEPGTQRVVGVRTRDSGIAKDGSQKATFEPGMDVSAAVTVFAEGVRGNLAKDLFRKLPLMEGRNPQTFGTGIKEIWQVRPEVGAEYFGKVVHTGGYPLDTKSYGGSWIYGIAPDKLSLGFVVGLDQGDAKLDPHALFVQWKQHPRIKGLLDGGKALRYGAKAVPEGGYFSQPKLYGDGFVLVGDTAGFLNAAKLKGIHLAIESGMLAAEAIAAALAANDTSAAKLARYDELYQASPARAELWQYRNYRQAFAKGIVRGSIDFGVQMVTGGRGLKARRDGHSDHECMQPVSQSKLTKPAFNDSDSLDKLTDVYLSGSIHEEDQPSHLVVNDPSICVERCTREFGNPCQHFCPAAVYEWPAGTREVLINASNCVHCKTCDIMDPYENIEWVVPEGGGGPKYLGM